MDEEQTVRNPDTGKLQTGTPEAQAGVQVETPAPAQEETKEAEGTEEKEEEVNDAPII